MSVAIFTLGAFAYLGVGVAVACLLVDWIEEVGRRTGCQGCALALLLLCGAFWPTTAVAFLVLLLWGILARLAGRAGAR